MPTRRGSIQLGGAPAPVEDSAMRAVDVGAAVEGRDSFGEEDDDEVPVKVLASDFDSAAMAPPPPRAPAPARDRRVLAAGEGRVNVLLFATFLCLAAGTFLRPERALGVFRRF